MTRTYQNADAAFPALLKQVLRAGELVESRNGKTKELRMLQFTLQDVLSSAITTVGRKVSLPAQIAETMWVLAGRNDVGWLEYYLPRAKDFADDGAHWRGGYGPRLRGWHDKIDQLGHVVKVLKEDPESRRAVFTIYDPEIDSFPGKDIPCNNWVHFLPRAGRLHAHVAIRSNDLFWGWSGINQFEWSALLQVVAGLVGMQPGTITFSISSLHLYEHHWARAEKIVQASAAYGQRYFRTEPKFTFVGETVEHFDSLVSRWFKLEAQMRKGGLSSALMHQVETFPEPMMRAWLFVLLYWIHDDQSFIRQYEGTRLFAAAVSSPKRKPAEEPKAPEPILLPGEEEFVRSLVTLHNEKHMAYGNSWKKRGEMLGIMANIARKIDRLGVAGGGDSSADTAIDLLIYCIKYGLWLDMQPKKDEAVIGIDFTEGNAHVVAVGNALHALKGAADAVELDSTLIEQIKRLFDRLEHAVEEKRVDRVTLVAQIIALAYPLAYRLWKAEEWQKGNATRQWNPERDSYEAEIEELNL